MSKPTLRLAQTGDLEPLVQLEARAMHFPMGHRVREWLTDHPTMTPERIAVAEQDGSIVAAAALVPEPFLYRGIPLKTGVWDAVATEQDYRRQGLCRLLMTFLENRHQPLLLLVEGVTEVYRRLGYVPAFPNRGGCNSGGALVRVSDLPSSGSWAVRQARPQDTVWLAELRRRVAQVSVLAAAPTEAQWRHSLREDRSVVGPEGITLNRWQETRILVAPDGKEAGYFAHDPWDLGLLMEMELLPGYNYRDAGLATLHSLAAFPGADELKIALPDDHALLAAFPLLLERRDRGGSDWHARIPDLVAFLSAICPALEAALVRSALVGYTGQIVVSRGRDSVRILSEVGSLSFIPKVDEEADVRLTEAAFIRLVLGQASLKKLMDEDRDIRGNDEGVALLNSLFPSGGRVFAKGI